MEPVHEAAGRAGGGEEGDREYSWTAWRGRLPTGFGGGGHGEGESLAGINQCVIDSLTYGVGTIEYRNRCGGKRRLGLRPLWPDKAKLRDFADFYARLRESVEQEGVKIPCLVWRIHGKYYCRYGASRLYVARELKLAEIPVIVCNFDLDDPFADPKTGGLEIRNPMNALSALGRVAEVGVFEVSHERIDIHNVVPA